MAEALVYPGCKELGPEALQKPPLLCSASVISLPASLRHPILRVRLWRCSLVQARGWDRSGGFMLLVPGEGILLTLLLILQKISMSFHL